MKKRVLIIFFMAILSLVISVSAIETTLKQEYLPGETLIVEIQGNFIENLKPEQILFYSGRVFTPLFYDLAKIQDRYYLYAILPEKERNYTLLIKNAHYTEKGQEKIQDLQYNFSVLGNFSLFSVSPGFIVASGDFNIKIKAYKNIKLEANFLNSSQEFAVSEGQERKISFSTENIKNFTFTNLIIKADSQEYIMPVAIHKGSETIPEIKGLKFSKQELNFSVLKNSEFEFEILLSNTGQQDIKNITLFSNLEEISKIVPDKIENLSAGNTQKINIVLKSKSTGVKNGTITASSGNLTTEIFFTITTVANSENLQGIINNSDIINTGSCAELNGKICSNDKECSVPVKLTLEGFCCTGTCNKKSSGWGFLPVVIIVILLAIIGFFVYRKIKTKKISSSDILKMKEKSFEERFKPTEIRGGLTKT